MGLIETAVRAWVRQSELDEGVRADGLTTAERTELVQLRKELRETRDERDTAESTGGRNDLRVLL